MAEAASPPWIRGHPLSPALSVQLPPAALAHAVAGVGEDVVHHATEGEDDEGDQGGDAGDEQAVLDGGGAALVHVAQGGR